MKRIPDLCQPETISDLYKTEVILDIFKRKQLQTSIKGKNYRRPYNQPCIRRKIQDMYEPIPLYNGNNSILAYGGKFQTCIGRNNCGTEKDGKAYTSI
jgi:hypothetical protein